MNPRICAGCGARFSGRETFCCVCWRKLEAPAEKTGETKREREAPISPASGRDFPAFPNVFSGKRSVPGRLGEASLGMQILWRFSNALLGMHIALWAASSIETESMASGQFPFVRRLLLPLMVLFYAAWQLLALDAGASRLPFGRRGRILSCAGLTLANALLFSFLADFLLGSSAGTTLENLFAPSRFSYWGECGTSVQMPVYLAVLLYLWGRREFAPNPDR